MCKNEYEKTLNRMKTTLEFAKDLGNINRCTDNVWYFNREQAWVCLQDMIREYESQINTLGLLIDGVRVFYGRPLEQCTDMYIRDQLRYIARYIPVYVLLREGEKELAKQIGQWLS